LLGLSALTTASWALDCANATTQADLNACAVHALKSADGELNDTYLALRARLNQSQKNQIRDVQLAWIKYRDLSCRFESSATAGGSARTMVLNACLARKTRYRAGELKAMQQCPEGDAGCVR